MDDIRPAINSKISSFIDLMRGHMRTQGLAYATEKTSQPYRD